MFAVTNDGETPLDLASIGNRKSRAEIVGCLFTAYGAKVFTNEGLLSIHSILRAATYSHVEYAGVQPALCTLRTHLPLGKLTLEHMRTLFQSFDTDLIRSSRDATGELPLHAASRAGAPVEILLLLVQEFGAGALGAPDNSGGLPLHAAC